MAADEKKSEIKKIHEEIKPKKSTSNPKDQRKIKTVRKIKEKTNKDESEEDNEKYETKIYKSEKARKKKAKNETETVCSIIYIYVKIIFFSTVFTNLRKSQVQKRKMIENP